MDLRQAKSYAYTLTDPYGNTDTGPLTVVAGVPNKFSNSFQISSPQSGPIFAVSVDTDANAD